MLDRLEREHLCRRCIALGAADSALPFALPGSHAIYAPDRVVDVRHIRLEISLDFDRHRVEGACTQTLAPLNDGPTIVELNAVEMEIEGVTLAGGAKLPFTYDGRVVAVDLGERKQGEVVDITVRFAATPRRGLYFIHPDEAYPKRPLQVWSQGQDEDNRYWFPCFDHPHEKSTSEMVVTVPKKMTALSNGSLVSERRDPKHKGRTFHYRHDVPHSSYLITLVAGEYSVLEDKFEDIDVLYYVQPGKEGDAPRTFARTPEMMRLFSERTGIKYPYARYSQITVAEFIFGGMENTSATTLTDTTLHDERAHLDFSSEPLIAHELAHQWFGDLVTCRDWAQGWLNEGFATYMEIVWKEHSLGRDEADVDRLTDIEAYFDEDAHRYRRPIVTNVYHEPIDVFDRHLYEKGGCVLHMLRTQLGDVKFWKAVKHYLGKHKGGSVETRDLARAIEESTGWNADRFFDQWVFAAGYPDLKVEMAWDEAEKLARVSVKQTQKLKDKTPLFDLPIPVRFVIDGKPREVTMKVSGREETFVVHLPAKPTQAIFDPGNNFLKGLEIKKPDELWKGELAGAEIAIDRLMAARALGKGADPTMIGALAAALKNDPFWAVRGAAAAALGEIKTTAAREVLAAALSAEKHPKARRQMVRALGAFRHDEKAADASERALDKDESYFVEAEAAMSLAKTRSPRAFDALKKAMKKPSFLDVIESMCLSGMAELRDERGIDVALEAAKYGKPVVGRRAAIAALGSLGGEHAGRKKQVMEVLIDLLEDPDFRARIAVVEALRVLGDPDAVGALRRAEHRDLDGRVRRRAREVARAIVEHSTHDAATRTLRDSVEKLEGENRELKERLSKVEARMSAGGGGGGGEKK